MFRKLIFIFISIPVAVMLIVLSVANRFPVTLNLDPFNPENPALSITLPFFVYLFIAMMIGVILGSIVTWWQHGKLRKKAREEHKTAQKLQVEADAQKKRADELAAEKSSQLLGLPTS